jgi:putative ABC transport system permease protein
LISTICIIIIGILFILVPHFVLPLGYIKGGEGALLLSECSVWYHPELYLGIMIIIGGLLSFRYKKVFVIPAFFGFLGIVQSFILRPISYFIQSEFPIIVLGQTYSLRSHFYIRESVISLSVITVLLSLFPIFFRRKDILPRITLFSLSSSNIKRRRYRSLVLILSLTIVIGAFFSNILLTQSIENTLELGAGRLGADLMVVPKGEKKTAEAVLLSGGPTMFYMKKDILQPLKAFPEIEKISPQLYVKPLTYKVCCIVENVLIIAYDPNTDFTVAPWIEYSLFKKQDPFDIVVGRLVKYYPGQKIDLFGKSLNVVASLEPTGLGYFDNSVFIPLDGARKLLTELKKRDETQQIPERQKIIDESFSHLFASDTDEHIQINDIDPEGISAFFIKTKDDVSVMELSEKIEKTFKEITVINVKESTITVKRHLVSILRAFFFPILILLIMGTIILSVVFSMSVHERQREIGLFRAMGARRVDIFRVIITESLILSSIGGIFGILFGSSLIFLFKNRIMVALELLYIWPTPNIIFSVLILIVAVSFAVGILAGFYPAFRAATMEPYCAIRSAER